MKNSKPESMSGPHESDATQAKTVSDGASTGQSVSVGNRQQKLREILNNVLTGEVIPRVFEANGGAAAIETRVDKQTSDAFRECILNHEYEACIAFVQTILDSGKSLKTICLGLFTVTAQELGELWNDDDLSFADVTIALGRLHKLVHHFSDLDSALKRPGARHNIILASAHAEQHAFGVLLVSKIFEMEGWMVKGGPDLHTGADLTSLVSQSWFDIIGLSASTEDLAHTLKPEIKKLRAASLNPNVFVIVGGNGFSSSADTVHLIGADELATDADDAIAKARSLLKSLQKTATH